MLLPILMGFWAVAVVGGIVAVVKAGRRGAARAGTVATTGSIALDRAEADLAAENAAWANQAAKEAEVVLAM